MTGLRQSQTVDESKRRLDISGFEIFYGVRSDIKLELAIGFFLFLDVPNVQSLRYQLGQQ